MVELLIGKKGTGKTKALIEKVNNALTVAKGNVVSVSYTHLDVYKRQAYGLWYRCLPCMQL